MKLAIAGSGNVATHLAKGFHDAGVEICAVWSRDHRHAARLAELCDARVALTHEQMLDAAPDVVLFSIADNALEEVVDRFPAFPEGTLALHTSGTLSQDILLGLSEDAGILYPLQTFSKDVELCLSDVPFFVQATNMEALGRTQILARLLSTHVFEADEAARRKLHIAGVLGCNFPNFLWECCERLLGEAGFSLSVIRPLVDATVRKAFSVGPHAAQTGPARRGDRAVIKAHENALEDPELRRVYSLLSELIIKSHKS